MTLIAPDDALDQLSEIFQREDKSRATLQNFYGHFIMEGSAILKDVAMLYGNLDLDPALQDLTLDLAIRKTLRRYAVQGDSVQLCGLLFTVRSVQQGLVIKVGVKLPAR